METLKDIFVPYKIASKLKEIGFDEPCIGAYDCYCMLHTINSNDKFSLSKNEIFAYAPTYEQVFKWFRQRRIYGNINPFLTSLGIEVQDKNKDYHRATFGFATYQQAQERLILKLIEIYKNGK